MRQIKMFGNKPKEIFYDIEAWSNYFCCGFLVDNFFEFHYLLENDEDEEHVLRALEEIKNDEDIDYQHYNLKHNAERFKEHFNIQKPRKGGKTTLLSNFTNVEEIEVLPREDVYFGFNTLNYDLPMIHFVLQRIIDNKLQTTPSTIRKYSNQIINSNKKHDTLEYELYGNQVDICRLNDKLMEKGKLVIGLKTLVGILGGQIKESESNKTGFSKDICDDTKYNFNDIIEMRDVLYKNSMLESMYQNKKELINTYESLRKHNITVNRTTATFPEYIIAPDKPIDDDPIVDYMFPAKHEAEQRNIKQFDMLEYLRNWYIKNVYKPVSKTNPEVAEYLIKKLMSIYSMYDDIRGKNWNTSKRHFNKFKLDSFNDSDRANLRKKYATNLQFVDKYGNLSSTFVTFSLGGIHGQEFHIKLFEKDQEFVKMLNEKYKYFSKTPKEVSKKQEKFLNFLRRQSRTSIPNIPQRLVHEVPEFVEMTEETDEIVNYKDFSPFYVSSDGVEELYERYTYTSVVNTIHQDFDGYYPMLMILLGTFYDGIGLDIYKTVYDNRIHFKNLRKTVEYLSEKYLYYDKKQDCLKLVCNTTSGILDGKHDTNLRANNKSIKMRSCGQFCTFIIGQALATEGAHIPSTNTDGLYASNIDINLNKEIVDRELTNLLVTITPEDIKLISKNTNVRIELENDKVISTKGDGIKVYSGADITTRSTKPTITDRIVVDYLQQKDAVNKEFDRKLAYDLIMKYRNEVSPREFLQRTAWLMRPTKDSVFIDSNNNIHKGSLRVFITNDGLTLKKLNTAKNEIGKSTEQHVLELADSDLFGSPDAVKVVNEHNLVEHFADKAITTETYKTLRDINNENNTKTSIPVLKLLKISNTTDNMRFTFHNDSLFKMTDEECNEIIDNLNFDEYITVIGQVFRKWQNAPV